MSPFLDTGDELLIVQKRKEYMKLYKASWMKEKRKRSKEVRFLLSEMAYNEINTVAQEHNVKLTPFIKHAVQAYMNKTYINPNKGTLDKMIQILKMMFIRIEDLQEEHSTLAHFLVAFEQLEREIRIFISSPPNIESYIVKHIQKDIKHKAELLILIHSQC